MAIRIPGLKQSRSKRNGFNALIVSSYWQQCGLPAPVFEHRFHPDRKWAFDAAWPNLRIAVEADGGIWINGGHNRGAGIKRAWEKENEAHAMGWRILKFEPSELCLQTTVEIIKRAMNL
jgi:hypothetical protein